MLKKGFEIHHLSTKGFDKLDHVIDLELLSKQTLNLNYKQGLKGLAAMIDIHICKYEQMGNWARRPLRGTQMH